MGLTIVVVNDSAILGGVSVDTLTTGAVDLSMASQNGGAAALEALPAALVDVRALDTAAPADPD